MQVTTTGGALLVLDFFWGGRDHAWCGDSGADLKRRLRLSPSFSLSPRLTFPLGRASSPLWVPKACQQGPRTASVLWETHSGDFPGDAAGSSSALRAIPSLRPQLESSCPLLERLQGSAEPEDVAPFCRRQAPPVCALPPRGSPRAAALALATPLPEPVRILAGLETPLPAPGLPAVAPPLERGGGRASAGSPPSPGPARPGGRHPWPSRRAAPSPRCPRPSARRPCR